MADAVFVWRYDYELGKDTSWTAHVAGYTEDECRDYLFKVVGRGAKINSISQICRLDAISDQFRGLIIEAAMPKKKKVGRPPKKKGPGRPPKITDEKKEEEVKSEE